MEGGNNCLWRGWCSRETRQALVQLVLLCVASCSWTLLLISLSLTSSVSDTRRHVESVTERRSQWLSSDGEACEECLNRRGPPDSYWRVFELPLRQTVAALNRLDQPLAPPALRAHLIATRSLLRRLASALHLTIMDSDLSMAQQKWISDSVLLAGDPILHPLACPEQFLGARAGYPRYARGFALLNCSAPPIKQVVTALIWDVEHKHLMNLIHSFRHHYPGMNVILLTDSAVKNERNLIIEKPKPSLTEALRRILSNIHTPYVLLGPRLTDINGYARLERLVWMSERSGVWASGGAIRSPDGRWRVGCVQARQTSGELMYVRGYDVSLYECQLCHTIEGPFVIRMSSLEKLGWPKPSTPPQLLLPELFLDIHTGSAHYKHAAALCPDSMFLVSSQEPPWEPRTNMLHQGHEERKITALWQPLMERKRLVRLHLPSGLTINFPCDYLPGVHQTQSRYSPLSKDSDIPAAWACEKHELTSILTSMLRSCHRLHVKPFLCEPALSVLLDGGKVSEVEDRSLELGVAHANVLPKLYHLLNTTHNAVITDGNSLNILGRWWTVRIVSRDPPKHAHWARLEVVEGLALWSALPVRERWPTDGGGAQTFPDISTFDSSSDDDLLTLKPPSRCRHERILSAVSQIPLN